MPARISPSFASTFISHSKAATTTSRAMARGYTVERYRRIIDRIRERMPDASLSADDRPSRRN